MEPVFSDLKMEVRPYIAVVGVSGLADATHHLSLLDILALLNINMLQMAV